MISDEILEGVIRFVNEGLTEFQNALNAAVADGQKVLAFFGNLMNVAKNAASNVATAFANTWGGGAQKGFTSGWGVALGKFLSLVKKTFDAAMEISKKLTWGGGLGMAGLFYAAASGSAEMEKLKNSFTMFARELMAGFAPYVRFIAGVLDELTASLKRLTPEQKMSVAGWMLVGTAIAGLIVMLPTIVAGFTALMGIVTAAAAVLVTPWGAAIAGIAAFGALMYWVMSDVDSNAATTASNINKSNKSWFDFVFDGLKWLAEKMESFWNNVARWGINAAFLIKSAWKETQNGLAYIMSELAEALGIVPAGTTNALIDDIERERKALEAQRQKMLGAWQIPQGTLPNAVDAARDKLKNLWNGAGGPGFGFGGGKFESYQATWDRLMGSNGLLVQAQKTNDNLQKIDDKAGNTNVILNDIKDFMSSDAVVV